MAHGDARVLLSAQTLAAGNGGVGTVARMTAAVLSEQFAVEALACQDSADHRIGSVPVRSFGNRRVAFLLSNLIRSARFTHVLYDHAGTARAHMFPAIRQPYAVWIHGWEVWGETRPDYLKALRGAAVVIANSAYTVDRAGSLLAGLDVRICTLGTPADQAPAFAPSDAGPPTMLLLGRADDLFAKGHDLLIEIWPMVVSAVPDARLLLVGGGSALDRVRALAASSPVRDAIDVTGFVPDEHLERHWRRATAFAMPGFAEGFGLVYAEAMRHALPIVASVDDGAQHVNVDGVTGFNVARADKRRLTDVVVSLLKDRDYARALGAAAHVRWREMYSFSSFRNRLLPVAGDFIEGTIGDERRGRH